MELQPAHYSEQECHTAQGDRQVLSSIVCGEGVAFGANNGDDLAVTDGPSGMQVTVGSGNAFVQGDTVAWQGMYHVTNDGDVNLTLSASDPTDDRIDLIVARVYDAQYAGALNEWALEVVTGTPSPAPVAPALPANAVALAQVLVEAAQTDVQAANITDVRTPYETCSGSLMDTVVFTVDGAFAKATYPGLKFVKVWAQGGGGRGAGQSGSGAADYGIGSGGAAGSCGVAIIAASALSASTSVVVGATHAGGPGLSGGTGNPSNFGASAVGNGGAGGTAGPLGTTPDATAGAVSTTGGTGDYVIPGGAGHIAYRASNDAGSFSGAGGDSHFGRGGRAVANESNGNDGDGYGGGGSGAKVSSGSSSDFSGGDGSAGVVIVEVYG